MTIDYFQYMEYLNSNMIAEAMIIEKEFHGRLTEEIDLVVNDQVIGKVDRFVVTLPYVNESVLAEWNRNNLKY